ncbi:hypothetical protein LOTGIDRAFT_174136 [Lottia gigantea]|uniref:Uncharacterized protein n=1 Tax=Lottia gigantea TaxID=225164 RepID=V4AN69_LOTGI|nr:hypothetical protein LOTGIDRAFT_174136 [Lottia gigantea]ESO98602.1 hypothetical protein LOTGIDRAFT_174136 [Lottia gigantea]
MARTLEIAVTRFIKRLLYSTFKGNRFTKIGLAAVKLLNLWVNKMLPKLTAFYYACQLPELCAQRYGRSPSIREPGVCYLQKDAKPKQGRCKPSCSGTKLPPDLPTRQRFVGREISHRWIVYESSDNCKWYRGSVLDVTSGLDGNPDADIYYHSEDETYSINHLVQDFKEDSVKFIDA